MADTQTALSGQLSSAEDVDMAATLSKLSLVQTEGLTQGFERGAEAVIRYRLGIMEAADPLYGALHHYLPGVSCTILLL